MFDTAGKLNAAQIRHLLQNKFVTDRPPKHLGLLPTLPAILRSLVSSVHKVVLTKTTPEYLELLGKLADDGRLLPIVGAKASLSDAIEFLTEVERGTQIYRGKAVIEMIPSS